MSSSVHSPQTHSPPFSSATAANQTSADIGNTMHIRERELLGNESLPTSEISPSILSKSSQHRLSSPPSHLVLQGEHSNGKWKQKIQENPFVPLGALVTVGALGLGLRAFRAGESQKSQIYMRWRVGAQGATLLALLGGIYYVQHKKKQQQQQLHHK